MVKATFKEKSEVDTEQHAEAQIVVPLGDFKEHEYRQRHVDLRLDPHQADILRKIVVGLNERHAQLKNKRHIHTGSDAIRWLLEAAIG